VATVVLKDLTLYYGKVLAVDDISLEIEDGKLYVLLGPTGCGKTSTMRMIAGLEKPTQGDVILEGERINDLYPGDRDVAMVFQDYALYPHKTVRAHFEFPLLAVKTPKDEVERRVAEIAEFLQLNEFLDRHPSELSMGQQQRVAIGRALIRRPKVFLMDEPLGQLDGRMRAEMRASIKRLQRELAITTIYVTHDQVEAQSLGDKIVVMRRATIQQVGSPAEVYNHPSNLFVAGFIGTPSMNFVECTLQKRDDEYRLKNTDFILTLPKRYSQYVEGIEEGTGLIFGVRPEHIRIFPETSQDTVPVEVDVLEPQGTEFVVGLNLGEENLKARQDRRGMGFRPDIGQTVYARFLVDKLHLFDMQTEESIF
jgi:multiple sugar transport system ATP-binding protein